MKALFSSLQSFLKDSTKTAVGIIGGFLIVGAIGGAYAAFPSTVVPAETNFDSGKILQSADMKSLANNLREARTQLGNFTFFDGKIGIGQANPAEKLDIAGNIKAEKATLKTSSGNNAELDIQSGTTAKWGIYQQDGTGELNFWNTDNRLTITNAGNIGIGTTTPNNKLHVNGNISANQYCDANGNNCSTPPFGSGGGGSGADSVSVGVINYFAASTPPDGYLECNGQAVSRTTYPELFSIIGITYGAGNGSTTFNLPNLGNQFIRGSSSSRAVGSWQGDQIQSHSHTYDDFYAFNLLGIQSGGSSVLAPSKGTFSTNPVGGDETRPVNIALLPCIKAVPGGGGTTPATETEKYQTSCSEAKNNAGTDLTFCIRIDTTTGGASCKYSPDWNNWNNCASPFSVAQTTGKYQVTCSVADRSTNTAYCILTNTATGVTSCRKSTNWDGWGNCASPF